MNASEFVERYVALWNEPDESDGAPALPNFGHRTAHTSRTRRNRTDTMPSRNVSRAISTVLWDPADFVSAR